MTLPRLALAAASLAALLATTSSASAESVGYKINSSEPDKENLHLAGSLYYAMIGSNLLNVGAHAQATYAIAPAIEVQGIGMVNIPGISHTSLLRVEGSAFLAIPWLGKERFELSSTPIGGNKYLTEYIDIPEVTRRKFGIEGGVFFDRHGVKLIKGNDDLTPVTSFGAFAGLKFVSQSKADIDLEGYRGRITHFRHAYYIHVMRAFSQAFDQPPGVTPATEVKGAPLGLRLGLEGKFPGEVGYFVKFEGGYMPAARGVDGFMMLYFGAAHSRSLF